MDILHPALTTDEDTTSLLDVLSRLLADKSDLSTWRKLRDAETVTATLNSVWSNLCEQGWPLLPISEEAGGLGLSPGVTILAAREIGRSVAPVPFLGSCLIGPVIYAGCRAEGPIQELAAGDWIGYAIEGLVPTFSVDGNILSGTVDFAVDIVGAKRLLTTARDSNGELLIIAPTVDDAMSVDPLSLFDHRNYAEVKVQDRTLSTDEILGRGKEAEQVLSQARDLAAMAAAAEMLGIAETAFGMALEYMKIRKQFGQTIGSFQALQHRAARVFCELEVARGVLYKAALDADGEPVKRQEWASLAKAKIGGVALYAIAESFQFHGGIAMSDEFDMGLLLKRAHTLARQFGNVRWHENRLAALWGY